MKCRVRTGKIRRPTFFLGSNSSFYDLFEDGLVWLGVSRFRFKPYSLRRGGATCDFQEHGSAATTQLKGRWSSLRTARAYFVEGMSLIGQSCIDLSLIPCARLYLQALYVLLTS